MIMKNLFKRLLWIFIVSLCVYACTENELSGDMYEFCMGKVNFDSVVKIETIKDSVQLNLLADLPGGFEGPYTVSKTISVPTITSPIQAPGAIMISATISYTYVVQQGGMKFLLSVDGITTQMQHTTNCYLLWTDLGSLYGPINIQVLDERFVDYSIRGRISGTEGFFHSTNPANEIIEYRGSFNINLY